MTTNPSIDELWSSSSKSVTVFDPASLSELPEPARRYLIHAIRPGTPLATAVRLRMHGQIRQSVWSPFTADEIITNSCDLVWQGKVRKVGLPVAGFDSLIDGVGEMDWKLLGAINVASGTGADITRSMIGRLHGETIWLPSLLCGSDVTWTSKDSSHAKASFTIKGESVELSLGIARSGQVKRFRYKRWGNPGGGSYRYEDFGGYADKESTYGCYTIPCVLRVGWYFGTDRFAEGEFYKVKIDGATFR